MSNNRRHPAQCVIILLFNCCNPHTKKTAFAGSSRGGPRPLCGSPYSESLSLQTPHRVRLHRAASV